MDIFQIRILRLLQKYGPLTGTKLYHSLHRYRAQIKNDAIRSLKASGLIKQELKWQEPKARKPVRLFSITELGEHRLQKVEEIKNKENKKPE